MGNSEHKLNEIFHEILCIYKERGYRKLDMSSKSNIFDSDALIEPDMRLKDFYDNQTKKYLEKDKTIDYLENLNKLTINKINTNVDMLRDVDENYGKFLKKETSKNINEIEKDIKKTLKHNKGIKKYFENKEVKKALKTSQSNEKKTGKIFSYLDKII